MRSLLIFFIAVAFWNCRNGSVYEASKDMRDRMWVADSVLTFDFTIDEPFVPHHVNIALRNTTTYPYYNLYVVYYLKDSADSLISTDLVNFHLFDPKTGRPLGSGVGGIYSHKFSLIDSLVFQSPGAYQLEIEQNMRLDLLPGIVSVGLEITH
jgi:gliding motility-associated lipoprotein GldH